MISRAPDVRGRLTAYLHRRAQRWRRPEEAAPDNRLDLRLLGAVLPAWALTAWSVSRGLGLLLWLTGALFVAAVVLGGSHTLVGRGMAGRVGWRVRRSSAVGLVLLSVSLSLVLQIACTLEAWHRAQGAFDSLVQDRATATLTARVVTDPVQWHSAAGTGWSVRIQVREVRARGQDHHAYGPVLVTGDERLAGLRWHSAVSVSGRLQPPDPGRSEAAVLRLTAAPTMREAHGGAARVAEHLRSGLRAAVASLPPDARGLLPGLVIGDTSATPQDLTDAMRATGMTHLVAVSGSNVAIVTALVMGLCALVGVPRRWRFGCCALAVIGFVILARPEPSVVRAATMGVIGLIGFSRKGRSTGPPVLAAAVVVLLLFDPWLARSFGFALSTLATIGLLLFVRPWGSTIGSWLPARIHGWGGVLAIPLAAQVMCAPVIVVLQESVSIVGVFANLLAAPLVAPATIGGVAAALLAPLSSTAASWLAWGAGMPTLGIAAVARRLSVVPGGQLPWPGGAHGALLLAALTVLLLLCARGLAHRAMRAPVLALWVLSVGLAWVIPTRVLTWPLPGWLVIFCDVGQGDGALVRTGPDSVLIVDVGPDPALMSRCLSRVGSPRIDGVMLTHFHADHVDGLPSALSALNGSVFTSPIEDPPEQVQEVHRWAAARSIPVQSLAAGDVVTVGSVTAQVWEPRRRISAGSVSNNASLVLAVEVAHTKVLLLGDIEREAGQDLVKQVKADPAKALWASQVDAVKTPHHGSANIDPALVDVIHAPVAVVSVGADNDYGHPSAKQLDLFRSHGFAIYRTDLVGDIALVADEKGKRVITYAQ